MLLILFLGLYVSRQRTLKMLCVNKASLKVQQKIMMILVIACVCVCLRQPPHLLSQTLACQLPNATLSWNRQIPVMWIFIYYYCVDRRVTHFFHGFNGVPGRLRIRGCRLYLLWTVPRVHMSGALWCTFQPGNAITICIEQPS